MSYSSILECARVRYDLHCPCCGYYHISYGSPISINCSRCGHWMSSVTTGTTGVTTGQNVTLIHSQSGKVSLYPPIIKKERSKILNLI